MDLIRRLPAGERVLKMSHRVEETVKGMILPGIFFEELGLRYLGPIDGHNLDELIPVLQKIRTLRGPIVLHVITKKGRGRPYAEADPIRCDSPAAALRCRKRPKRPTRKPPRLLIRPSWSPRFAKKPAATAASLPSRPPCSKGTGLSAFQQEFPDRTLDVGIAEEHAVTCAAGMACDGPCARSCAFYSSFLQRAIDQIIHDVALQNLPVVIGVDRGGCVGDDGPTHHGVFDLTYLRMIPQPDRHGPDGWGRAARHDPRRRALRGWPGRAALPRAATSKAVLTPRRPRSLSRSAKAGSCARAKEFAWSASGAMTGHALAAADLLAAEGNPRDRRRCPLRQAPGSRASPGSRPPPRVAGHGRRQRPSRRLRLGRHGAFRARRRRGASPAPRHPRPLHRARQTGEPLSALRPLARVHRRPRGGS